MDRPSLVVDLNIPQCLGSLSLSDSSALDLSGYKVQSGELPALESGTEETTSIVTRFLDETPGTLCDMGTSQLTNLNDMQELIELEKYLSRPVLIKTHTWAETDTAPTYTQWNPWYLFFNSTPIKNKINNYGFINCKLKLKFVINASPFYSGAMAFCYSPLLNYRTSTIIADASQAEVMEYSQQPKVWVFPQTNQGGEITLPFFYHGNWLDLTSATKLQAMGTITPAMYAPLVSALGTTGTSVLINVYAWAEDIKLHAPTTSLAVQADEYDTKPSQIASAVSKAAKELTRVPVIGPYMKATSLGVGALGKVSAALGFTNVPNIDTVNYLKPAPFPQHSSCDVSTPLDRLVIDPKNEVCLDPRTVGLDGKDELEISYITERETYLGNAILSSTDAIDALTLVSRVTPQMAYQLSPSTPIHFTPMGYLSTMFGAWRGDIIFRFKFICTRFHKGRVRITFDPLANISTTVPDYTTVFNEIVDIGCENDIEIIVPYSQAITYLNTSSVLGNYNFSGSSLAPNANSNGLITMRVVNPLSGPQSPTAIPVMVFVRGGPSLEFAQPDMLYQGTTNLSPYTVQSNDLEFPVKPKMIIAGNGSGKHDPNKNLVHYGETIVSMRPLLHRAVYHNSLNISIPLGLSGSMSLSQTRLPLYYGYDTNGISSAFGIVAPITTFNFNFVKMNIHQLISLMFVGQRGSINWTVNLDNALSFPNLHMKRNGRAIVRANYKTAAALATGTVSAVESSIFNTWLEPNSGTALTDQRTLASISANVPYYSNYNFQFVNASTATLGSINDASNLDTIMTQAFTNTTGTSREVRVHKFFSYGHDYNFFFFLNTPSLYVLANPVPN